MEDGEIVDHHHQDQAREEEKKIDSPDLVGMGKEVESASNEIKEGNEGGQDRDRRHLRGHGMMRGIEGMKTEEEEGGVRGSIEGEVGVEVVHHLETSTTTIGDTMIGGVETEIEIAIEIEIE